MNNNYDPLEDTTYDDLEEDPYSHNPQEGEFSEDFPSKLRRGATGARNVEDEMTDGPIDENSKEGEVESFLSVVDRCHSYELPSPEDCSEHAPQEMKALIHVPNRAWARGNANFSHFFRSVKVFDEGEEKSKYLCPIMTNDSYKTKLSGGAGMIGRESHMNSTHKAVYEAFRLFQGLQSCLGRLPVDPHTSQEQQEYQAPSTPKRTLRKSKFQSALPGIPIPTLEDKATVEACWLNLLSEGVVNYSLFDNPYFRKIKEGSEHAGIRRPCLTDDEEESRQYHPRKISPPSRTVCQGLGPLRYYLRWLDKRGPAQVSGDHNALHYPQLTDGDNPPRHGAN
ncbi:MAG: hypothetical protein J3R72DRAFT_479979 [Linnemannia gamsii]|nr:MAG: hypothetical protein J3R72DRAFT_479979 [Linnemannia gamsii]